MSPPPTGASSERVSVRVSVRDVVVRAESIAWVLAILFLLTACGTGTDPRPRALVFAAASLTSPFEEIARAFEERTGHGVDLHFAGTSQLVVQLREGAAVDVFASADEANMEKVRALGHVTSPPSVFATNRLVIVTRPDDPQHVRTLADLARPDLRVLLCGPEVPAGRYARQILAQAGVEVRSRSDEPSVKAVLSKVQLGEADAGIVYATDVAAAEGRVAAVLVPEAQNVVATYPVAVLSAGKARAVGEAFVAFLLSAEGRTLLQAHGFGVP